jgi:hypothetical protein
MIKQFLTDKKTEAWAWMALNAFLVLLVDYLVGLKLSNVWLAMIIAGLNVLTKYINVTYLK